MTETSTVDRIVARVLSRLGTPVTMRDKVVSNDTSQSCQNSDTSSGIRLNHAVITAEVLLSEVKGRSTVQVSPRAIITPAGHDVARERGIDIVRRNDPADASVSQPVRSPVSLADVTQPSHDTKLLFVVVRNTGPVQQLTSAQAETSAVELTGCPDDAAALATSALCRGDAGSVVIFAEQSHRAACLANRNERVKAVAVADVGDARRAKQQLRANVWCIDPTDRSYFELHNLLRFIQSL